MTQAIGSDNAHRTWNSKSCIMSRVQLSNPVQLSSRESAAATIAAVTRSHTATSRALSAKGPSPSEVIATEPQMRHAERGLCERQRDVGDHSEARRTAAPVFTAYSRFHSLLSTPPRLRRHASVLKKTLSSSVFPKWRVFSNLVRAWV